MISVLRRVAQTLRHAPLLRSLPIWNALRGPYLRLLNRVGAAKGISVVVGDTKVRLHPDFATQNWEHVERASYSAFVALLQPGDVVYDVGAHIGTYTLVAIPHIKMTGRVVAYEPSMFTRRYLEQHLDWNGVRDRVITRDLCIGAVPGQQMFYYAPGRAEGMAGLIPVEGFAHQMVNVTTLDREVDELGLAPSVIKIDVEGAEMDVLHGAENTLSRHHPRISLSLHPAALATRGLEPVDVLRWLSSRGYETTIISRDHEIHVICVSDASTLKTMNVA